VGRVGIDLQFLAERADAGKRVSRTKLAGDDSLGGSVDNLLGESDAGLEDQAEWDHKCIITASTARMQEKTLPGGKFTGDSDADLDRSLTVAAP